MTTNSKSTRLVAADLITDARLQDAEDDAFRHREIAGRVAELAATTRTPCNVALYGPWGSGKSSFFHLLSEEVALQSVPAKVIRYDAWKFGGHALKRNFISNAADQLKIDTSGSRRARSDFHGGLHQSMSSVELRPENIWRGGTLRSMLMYAVLAGVLAVLISAIWAGVEVWATDSPYGGAFRNALRPIGTAMLTAAGAIGLGVKIFETANVTIDRTAPSEDDEFDELFGRLVARGKEQNNSKTLIFFIDELDRCSKSDVVATLTSLRTFLDQRDCVFIVAADREVLEEALSALEQETPVRADEPYYSSASAFLDKIFQYQFSLPPLRSGRLTGFARSLVVDNQSGLWADLRARKDGRYLDEVLYTLIPAHVRSPRRVKVLLNSFATNVRVAEARGVDWLARASEIAKLTVLQVEFPALAADLHLEPRLPTLLVDPPENRTSRQQMLLHRHGPPDHLIVDQQAEHAADGEDGELPPNGVEAPDRLLAGATSNQLRRRQYDDLLRYLESRSLAQDPARDLIYLEIAGATVGIDDPELGALVEDIAATDPGAVVSAVAGRTEPERAAVAKALGRQSENEFGPEQDNVVLALTGVAAGIDLDVLREGVGDLAQQLRSYRRGRPGFRSDMLAGVLKVGIAVGPDGADLVGNALDADDFYADADNVLLAAETIGYLDSDAARYVAEAAGGLANDRPAIVLSILRSESSDVVQKFLADAQDEIVGAFAPPPPPEAPAATKAGTPGQPAPQPQETSDPPDATEFLNDLFAVLLDRGQPFAQIATAFATRLLASRTPKGAYQSAYGLALELAGAASDSAARDKFALAGITWASPKGWSKWVPLLSEGSDAADAAARSGRAVLAAAWKRKDKGTEVAREHAAATLRAVLNGRTSADIIGDEGWDPVLAELGTAIDLTDGAAVAARHLLFDLAAVAVELDAGEDLTERLETALITGLEASSPASALDDSATTQLVGLMDRVPAQVLPAVYESWRGSTTDALVSDPYFCRVELALAKLLTTRTGGGPVESRAEAARSVLGSSVAVGGLDDWLATRPSAESGFDVLSRVSSGSVARALSPGVEKWASHLTENARTVVVRKLIDEESAVLDSTIGAVASQGVDGAALATHLAAVMAASTAKPARQRVVAVASMLRLRSYGETRPLAECAQAMLEAKESKSAIEDAAKLLSVIGSTHQLKGKIQQTLRGLDDDEQLTSSARRSFEDAGYRIRRKRKRSMLNPFARG